MKKKHKLVKKLKRGAHSKELELDIRKTLELASSLMPFEEGEFLDEAYQMFVENNTEQL